MGFILQLQQVGGDELIDGIMSYHQTNSPNKKLNIIGSINSEAQELIFNFLRDPEVIKSGIIPKAVTEIASTKNGNIFDADSELSVLEYALGKQVTRIQVAKEEAAVKAQEEAALKAQEEAELKAQEEAALKVQEEAALKAKEEAAVKAQEEAALKAQEEAELKAQEEAALKVQEEAALKAKEEAAVKAQEEAALKAQEEAELKAQEEAALKVQEEAALKAKEEAAVKAQEEAALKAQEEAELKAQEEATLGIDDNASIYTDEIDETDDFDINDWLKSNTVEEENTQLDSLVTTPKATVSSGVQTDEVSSVNSTNSVLENSNNAKKIGLFKKFKNWVSKIKDNKEEFNIKSAIKEAKQEIKTYAKDITATEFEKVLENNPEGISTDLAKEAKKEIVEFAKVKLKEELSALQDSEIDGELTKEKLEALKESVSEAVKFEAEKVFDKLLTEHTTKSNELEGITETQSNALKKHKQIFKWFKRRMQLFGLAVKIWGGTKIGLDKVAITVYQRFLIEKLVGTQGNEEQINSSETATNGSSDKTSKKVGFLHRFIKERYFVTHQLDLNKVKQLETEIEQQIVHNKEKFNLSEQDVKQIKNTIMLCTKEAEEQEALDESENTIEVEAQTNTNELNGTKEAHLSSNEANTDNSESPNHLTEGVDDIANTSTFNATNNDATETRGLDEIRRQINMQLPHYSQVSDQFFNLNRTYNAYTNDTEINEKMLSFYNKATFCSSINIPYMEDQIQNHIVTSSNAKTGLDRKIIMELQLYSQHLIAYENMLNFNIECINTIQASSNLKEAIDAEDLGKLDFYKKELNTVKEKSLNINNKLKNMKTTIFNTD